MTKEELEPFIEKVILIEANASVGVHIYRVKPRAIINGFLRGKYRMGVGLITADGEVVNGTWHIDDIISIKDTGETKL